ncbi:hypothetical protein LINGRAHAP2_LOCUS24920 [Linum grandiflorum]
MAPNSITGEEQQTFQHGRTLRRKDINESDLSRPTGEPSMKRPKLDSFLVPADNSDADENEDEDEDEEEDNKDDDYDDDGEANNVSNYSGSMSKKVRRRSTTRKRNVAARNKMKRVAAAKRASQRKSNASDAASEQVLQDELKNYMSSLLDEMKDTRGNLLTWLKEELKKTIAEEVASKLQRRRFSSHVNKMKTSTVEKTHPHNTSKNRHQSDSQIHAPPQVQQTMSIDGVSIKQQQQGSPFWSSRRDQKCDVEAPQRFANNNNKRPSSDAYYNFSNLRTENLSMTTQPIIPTEKKNEMLPLSVKSNSLTSPSGLEVQDWLLQQNIARTSTEKMYVTLPTNRNHRPEVPSFSNVHQPYRIPGMETSLNAEGPDLMWSGSGSYLGQLHDERSGRSFAAMGSREMSYLRNSYMTPSPMAESVGVHQSEIVGNFNTPTRQLGLEGLSRQTNHGVGLRIGGGGMRFSGGGYSLPVQHFPNNFH